MHDASADGSRSNLRSERELMVGWFTAQTTKGAGQYTREVPNRSAKRTYNRLLNSRSLLWINEAPGQDPERVQAAADEAAAEKDHRRRCGIVRKHLPWDEVIALANAKRRRVAGS